MCKFPDAALATCNKRPTHLILKGKSEVPMGADYVLNDLLDEGLVSRVRGEPQVLFR